MAEVPVEAIRQSHRYEMTLNRKKLKHEEADLRRSLADLRLNDVDLPALANKLKNKSEVTVSDLQLLKNILIQDGKNIRIVLNTQGALRGLVREISGLDVNRQVEAAGCLCNLALADMRGCLTIIRVAGAYLVAALDSQNLQLAITCAWTLGNLCGAGVQASKLLTTTGAVARLCAQMKGEEQRMDAAVYALTLFAHAMGDELSKEHLDLIVKSVASSSCSTAFRLYYMLSSLPHFSDPQALVETQLIHRFPAMMRSHHTSCIVPACCDVLYVVRALANMERGDVYYNLLKYIHERPEAREDFVDLFMDPRLKLSMLWLNGNIGWRLDHDYFIKHFDINRPPPAGAAAGGRGEEDDLAAGGGLGRFAVEEPELADMSDDE